MQPVTSPPYRLVSVRKGFQLEKSKLRHGSKLWCLGLLDLVELSNPVVFNQEPYMILGVHATK